MNDLTLLRNIISHIAVGAPFMMSDYENYMSRGFSPLTQQGYGLAWAAGTDLHRLAKSLFLAETEKALVAVHNAEKRMN